MEPDDEEDLLPVTTPEYHMSDDEVEGLDVEYSTRAPEDWVISGPLPKGGGPGRRFDTIAEAEEWVGETYPGRVKQRITEATLNSRNRWAYLIRGERGNPR